MIKFRVRRLLVVESNVLIGLITHNDLPQQIKPQLTVKDIIFINPVSVNENTAILEAALLLQKLNIGILPVINDYGNAVGIIAAYDLNKKKILN